MSKIEYYPDTLEVLYTMAEEADVTHRAIVTLRATYEGRRMDFDLSPEAARELASSLNQGADEAESE